MARHWHFRALRRKLQYGLNLFASNSEFLNQFIDAHILKVLEYSRNRYAGPPKHNGAASLAGNAFKRRTLRPIQTCHNNAPSLQYTRNGRAVAKVGGLAQPEEDSKYATPRNGRAVAKLGGLALPAEDS